MAVTRTGRKSLAQTDLRSDRQSIDDIIKYVETLMKEVCGSGIGLHTRVPIRITKDCPSPEGDSTDLCVVLQSLLVMLKDQRARLARRS